jgi:hypothetical protein
MGACQPFVVGSNVSTVSTDGVTVYWTDPAGTLNACPADTCSADKASHLTTPAGGFTQFSPIPGGGLLGYADGTLTRCQHGCASTSTVASNVTMPNSILAAGASVFWTDDSAMQIHTCALANCIPRSFESGVEVFNYGSLAADSKNLYWTTEMGLFSCPLTGCISPMQPSSSPPVSALATDSDNVYWVDQIGNLFTCPSAGCGVNPRTLVFGLTSTMGLASDGKTVFYTDQVTGTVNACAAVGCNTRPTVIATGQRLPAALQVTPKALYWINLGTKTPSLMKMAR